MELGKVGSGLDVEAIVSALVNADVAPKTNSLNRKESALSAELSAVGSLKSRLSTLETSLEKLSDGSAFDALSIDAPDEVSVTQTGSPSVGQYTIDVNSMAASQVLASSAFAGSDTTVGTGTLTFNIGTPTYASGSSGSYSNFTVDATKTVSIVIDSSNSTLSGIRDAVNASSVGVTASLVVDGSQTRLLFTADTSGAETAIMVSTDDDDLSDTDSSGLSRLSYFLDTSGETPTFVGGMAEARASQDAAFSLNGLSLTSPSNTIVGLMDGINVTLKKVTTSAESILIQKDSSAIETSVQSFLDAYNDYQTTLSSLTDYTSDDGALSGDATARRIQTSVRETTTGVLSLTGNAFTALSDIGITSDRYGELTMDASAFQAALASNADDLKTFFAGATTSANLSDNTDGTGLADSLKTLLDTYINSSSGMLIARENRIDNSLDDIAEDRLEVIARMESLEERYTKQFTAMDTLVSQLQGTSDFLTNQMDAIKAAANR